MLSSTAKMSLEASDVQTDEDCEELAEDAFSFSADFLEKRTSRKRSSSKPPPSPKSPYLSSMNVNTRRAAVAAWRLPRASLGDTRGDTPGEGDTRLTSLSNGHDLSQTLRSECDVTAELLRQTLSKNHKHLHPGSNGFTLSTDGYREKEDMYDEIIHLKKSLQAQKSDGRKMKAKLRRLEEELTKREKLIEELLDPTKGSEYTRSLVDKKKEGSVVINGLKQRILKLEQQCREKENALSHLQSELRTTNLEELKITAETYFDEIQRLRVLLKAAEKSSRAESKCSQRQQKVLSSTVHRLSENLKQLQQENMTLREELNTDSPAGGPKGYREWSRQRLLRRLLEVEKRLDDSSRHAQSAQHSGRLDWGVQATPTEILGFAMATEAVISVGTNTTEQEEASDLRERLEQSKKETVELQEVLSRKDDELRRLRTEREELETETERWKAEQTSERDKERQQHQQELDQLWTRIHALTDRNKAAELSSLCATSPEEHEDTEAGGGVEEERSTGGEQEKEGEGEEELAAEAKRKERERAALLIQTKWREHRNRDIVMLQSAFRGHLLRESQLQELLKDAQEKALETTNGSSNVASSVEGELDEVALTTLQSAFRGHLARCSRATESSEVCVPRRASRTGAASLHKDDEKQVEEEESRLSRMTPTTAARWIRSRRIWRVLMDSDGHPVEIREPHRSPESGGATAGDSDDSDDIIVSPSRPLRSREVFML